MQPSPPETRASLIPRLPNAADVAAWDELVAVYGPLVYRVALRQGLQPADADDLLQEVFGAIASSLFAPAPAKRLAWNSAATQIQTYDQELDAFEQRGRQLWKDWPAAPGAETTSDNPPPR